MGLEDTFQGMNRDKQDLKDQIATPDDILPIFLLIRRAENDMDTSATQIFNEREIAGTNCFILGSTDYGILGTGRLGASDIGSYAQIRVQNSQNRFVEIFSTTQFKDATNTTATWNTTTHKITF